MAASHISARACRTRRLFSAVASVLDSILQRANGSETPPDLRVECEKLEERRLLSAVIFRTDGQPPYFDVYRSYSYLAASEDCCGNLHLTFHSVREVLERNMDTQMQLKDEQTTTLFPVRYADGQPIVETTDLGSDGFGQPWGQSRAWADPAGAPNTGTYVNGNNWTVSQMPQVVQTNASPQTLAVVLDGNSQLWFTNNGSNQFTESGSKGDTLTVDSTTNEYVLANEAGEQEWFYSLSDPSNPGGQLDKIVDPAGNVTQASYGGTNDPSGVPQGMLKSVVRGSGSDSETWYYSYQTAPDYGTSGRYLLSRVILSRGSTNTVTRQVGYSYYGTGSSFGNVDDLQQTLIEDGGGPGNLSFILSAGSSTLSVGTSYYYVVTAVLPTGETTASNEVMAIPTAGTPQVKLSWAAVPGTSGITYKIYRATSSGVEDYLGQTTNTTYTDTNGTTPPPAKTPVNMIDRDFYRYYTSDTGLGYQEGLEYVFGGAAYARAVAAGYDPSSSTNDSGLQLYADNYFEYNDSAYGYTTEGPGATGDHLVTAEIAHGAGCSCTDDGG